MEDIDIFLDELLAETQEQGNLFRSKAFLMQLHHPRESLYISPNRDNAVMGLPGDLVIGCPSQPTPNHQHLMALTSAYPLQMTPSRQIHTLFLQSRTVSFDGPHRDVQNPRQILLAGGRPLGHSFIQQSLDSPSSQRLSTVSLTYLIVFLTSMNRPDNLFRFCDSQRPPMTGISPDQDNSHLSRSQLSLAQQAALGIGQDCLGYARRLAKLILQKVHKALLRRFGLVSSQLFLIHSVTSL